MKRISPARRLRAVPVLAVVMAAVFSIGALAEEPDGGIPGSWLSRYTGARTLGLGGAFVATADEPTGVVWNPAGLSVLDQNEFRFETARLFEDTSINGFSFAVPGSRIPSFGITVLALRSGEFERTNELNDDLGTFNTGDTAFLFTVSKNVTPRLAVGGNLKLARQSVEEWNGGGLGFDLGGIYDLTSMVRVGASILNVGGPNLNLREVDESFPTEVRLGFSANVLGRRGLVTAEIDHVSDDGGFRFHGGTEYWIQPSLALRVGYNDANAAGGFSYRVDPRIQLDYGVSDHELGFTHRVGLSYRFGGFFASSRAVPEVFSPTGERSVTKIYLQSRTKDETESWRLAILNKSDETVRRFAGKGVPPAHLVWDGKDESGLPLPDGVYRYQLQVNDREGREIESPTQLVEISTEGPRGRIQVFPSD
jgi:hypothetical protein